MTIQKDAGAVTEVDDCVANDNRKWVNPFSTRKPTELLGRSFLISTITWTAASGTTWIPLIGQLSQQTAALAFFKLWRMARCCFKIHAKTTSSIYFQGAALLGWLPCINTGTVPQDTQSLTGYHCTVISAAKKESVTMNIPYCGPEDFFDTTAFNSSSNEHASIFFSPLFTILTTNDLITAAVTINVWGSIDDIDMSGAQSQSRTKNKEASKKDQEGKDAAVGSVIRNTSQLVRRIPVIGAVWSPIADVINTIFSTELSKPLSSAVSMNMHQRYYDDHNQSDGVSNASQFSLYQNPRIKIAPIMYGMDTSFKSVRKYAGTPLLFDVVTFNGTTVLWTTSVVPNITGASIVTRDYLAIVARMFRYIRGSIKYLIFFCMPSFYSCRFRIRLQYNATVTNASNVPNMVVDVSGDTWVSLTVPMLNWRTWLDLIAANNMAASLIIEQLTPIVGQPSPSTAVVYCAIFRAGAEDLQVAFPYPPTAFSQELRSTTYDSEEEMDFSKAQSQTSIQEKFKEQFEPICEGQCFTEERNGVMSETIEALQDLMKRPAVYASTSMNLGTTVFEGPHSIIAASFMWQRGSIVFRHMHLGNTSTHGDGWYPNVGSTAMSPDYGWAAAYQNSTIPLQYEAISMPHYCPTPFYATTVATPYILASSKKGTPQGVILSLGAADTITKAAGDDSCFLFQVPWANQLALHLSKKTNMPKVTTANNLLINNVTKKADDCL